jgi:hypothetical protein
LYTLPSAAVLQGTSLGFSTFSSYNGIAKLFSKSKFFLKKLRLGADFCAGHYTISMGSRGSRAWQGAGFVGMCMPCVAKDDPVDGRRAQLQQERMRHVASGPQARVVGDRAARVELCNLAWRQAHSVNMEAWKRARDKLAKRKKLGSSGNGRC